MLQRMPLCDISASNDITPGTDSTTHLDGTEKNKNKTFTPLVTETSQMEQL